MEGPIGDRTVHTNDESLVMASCTADKGAYARLIEKYYKPVYLLALGMLAATHDAEDVAQETLLKGFTEIRRLRDPARFGPWILKIARNTCINHLRQRKPLARLSQDVAESVTQKPEPGRCQDLEAAIRFLPTELRAPLVMYYFDGRDVKRVAEALDVSPSTVYARLQTAIRQLHDMLTESGDRT